MASPKAFETYGQDWLRHPVGTGPFTFKEWVPGKHVILEKNPHYFKPGLPYLDRLEYRIMKDPLTASTALRAGEIDFFARVPMQQVPILDKSPSLRLVTGLDMAPTIAFLNMRVKPFDDVRARRAVGGYRIDRGEIAKVAFQGRATPLVSVLAPGVQDAIDLHEMYPYRPDEAKRLLQELGFDEKNPLRFTMLVGNQDMTLSDVATLLKNQMAKIDVAAKIQLVDTVAAVDRVLVKHEFEMTVSNFATLRDINQRSVSFFKGRQSDYMGINDPTLEAMVLQWRRTMDPVGRRDISAQIQRLIAEQLYWVNVTTYPFYQAYRMSVHNYPYYEQALVLFEQVWLDK